MNRRQFVESLIAAAALPIDGVRGSFTPTPGARAGAGDVGHAAARGRRRRCGTDAPRRSGSRRCRSATDASARWSSATSASSGCRSTTTRCGRADRAAGTRPARRRPSPRCGASTLAGDYAAADKAAHGLMGAFTQSYLPLGDVWLTFEHGNLGRNYRRELHLGDAVASGALPGRRRPLHARGDRQPRRPASSPYGSPPIARASSPSTRASPARCGTRSPSKTA